MTKTGCYLCAAIYACEGLILLVTIELKCFFNNRSEIFLFIYMNSTREGNHFCCEHSVDVAAFWRHQTICGVENSNPTLGHRTEANAFRALAPTAVNVCPLGRFFEGPGLVTSDTLVGETYYINVRTYDHEGTQIITAKLKLTAIEDPDEEYGRMEKVMFYGDGEDVSRFMTIELIEYDYSDVYKFDEYYESR